jgi:uncharacterized protein YfiM (DUF2279 family)
MIMYKYIIILLFVTLSLSAQIAYDKKLHVAAGALVGTWGTFAGNAMDLKPEGAALFGISSAAVAGLGKELWDEIDYGGWDWADFGATMIGGAIGTGLTYAGLKIFKNTKPLAIAVRGTMTVGVTINMNQRMRVVGSVRSYKAHPT